MSGLAALSNDAFAFLVACLVAGVSGVILARKTRGITFIGVNSDNEKQARAASFAGQWRWPSDMHKYGGGKTRMKDSFVLGLVGLRCLAADRWTEDKTVVLCVLANSMSAVLVFLIAETYWNVGAGLFIFTLFIISFWPYLLALEGACISLGQLFFLLSVYFIQRAEFGLPASGLAWYFASGLAIGLMMFAAASSRKYFPLLVGAFFYSQRNVFSPIQIGAGIDIFPFNGVRLAVATLAVVLLLAVGMIVLIYRRVVTAAYLERAPAWLNQLISARDKLSLEHYVARADGVVQLLVKHSLVIVLYLSACLMLSLSSYFYYSQFWLLLGICLVFAAFTYPNMIGNLKEYFAYWNGWKLLGHLRLYEAHFARIGKQISQEKRGGWQWVVLFFWKVAPFHSIYYMLSLGAMAYFLFLNEFKQSEVLTDAGIAFFSLSPVLVGELTGSPQMGRTYHPGFLGLLLPIAYMAFRIDQSLTSEGQFVFWLVAGGAALVSAGWNLRVFLNDVWPARMAPARLAQTLMAMGIKEFYTYDTHYNDAFVNALPRNVLERFKINFINTLRDVKEGYVVVPGTSAKAANMESQPEAIGHGDFNRDPVLTQLLDSRDIVRYAVASFKTFGTSRMWQHEAEPTTYRDLVLGEIGERDRWRGRAWILDAGKLHTENCMDNAIEHRRQSSASSKAYTATSI